MKTKTTIVVPSRPPACVASVPPSVLWRTAHQAISSAFAALRLGLWDNPVSEATSWIVDTDFWKSE
jgi:hypothetical protein